MNETISTKREYYIQAQLNNGQWIPIYPYDPMQYAQAIDKADELRGVLSDPIRVVEIKTTVTERVVYE